MQARPENGVGTATVGETLERAADRLAASGIDQPRREARLLLSHALSSPPASLLDPGRRIEPARFEALLDRRLARVPMAHITGRQGFWTLDLAITPATLIPRADSETLIEAARDLAPADACSILDLGTGSGALLLAALTLFPDAWGLGIDRSVEALAVARANAAAHGLSGRALFAAGDWARALSGRFDLVLANPPYIPAGIVPTLMPEVAIYEPRTALDGGQDGLDAYRAILPGLPSLLTGRGVAILEIGADQGNDVTRLARCFGHDSVVLRHDLGGNARALVLRQAGDEKSVGRAARGG